MGTLAIVANYALPPTDYRVRLADHQLPFRLHYLLPQSPLESGTTWVSFEPVSFGEGFEPADIPRLLRLWRQLLKRRSDLIAAHFFSTKLVLAGPLVARLARVPAVVTVTGFGRVFSEPRLRYQALRPIYLALLWLASHASAAVLFQNHADLKAISSRWPALSHKMHYVGSAVAGPRINRAHEPDLPLQVIHVGRLRESKGINEFLAVAQRLGSDPRFTFVLVGDRSPGSEQLFARVQAARRAGTIRWFSHLKTGDLWHLYRESDAIFFASHSEGLSRVMLEAGLAGLAPLAYDIPANRDLVSQEWLFPVGETEGVVRQLIEFARDPASLHARARAYQQHICTEFGLSAYATRLMAALDSSGVIKDDRRSRALTTRNSRRRGGIGS